jgi:hypothetical protein
MRGKGGAEDTRRKTSEVVILVSFRDMILDTYSIHVKLMNAVVVSTLPPTEISLEPSFQINGGASIEPGLPGSGFCN